MSTRRTLITILFYIKNVLLNTKKYNKETFNDISNDMSTVTAGFFTHIIHIK